MQRFGIAAPWASRVTGALALGLLSAPLTLSAALAQDAGNGATTSQPETRQSAPSAPTGEPGERRRQAVPGGQQGQRQRDRQDGPGCRYQRKDLQMLV